MVSTNQKKLYLPRMSKSTKLCPLVGSGILYMEKTLKTSHFVWSAGLPGLESLGHSRFFLLHSNQKTKKKRDSTLQSLWFFFKLGSHFFIPMFLSQDLPDNPEQPWELFGNDQCMVMAEKPPALDLCFSCFTDCTICKSPSNWPTISGNTWIFWSCVCV